MHVLSNHYYMPSGTFFFESRSSVTQCGTAVILMTLNEKGIWKKTRMSSRCAIFRTAKNVPWPCRSSGMSARRWTTDVRRRIRWNSRFGKRQREKITTRDIFTREKNHNPYISERGATRGSRGPFDFPWLSRQNTATKPREYVVSINNAASAI